MADELGRTTQNSQEPGKEDSLRERGVATFPVKNTFPGKKYSALLSFQKQLGIAVFGAIMYRDLVASTGGPGCYVLLGLRGGTFRRFCWVVVVSLLGGLMLRECASVFGEHAQYRVFTSVTYGTKASLPFPDVTVCNINPLRRSALCGARKLVRLEGLAEDVWRRECNEPAVYYEPNTEDAVLHSKLSLWIAHKKRHNRGLVRVLGHQLKHMLVGCRLGQKSCMHTRFFRRKLDSRYGNCFCLNCHSHRGKNNSHVHYEAVSAPTDGLTLTLDVQPFDYLPTSTSMGFLIMVHGHGFRADACQDSVFAQPGYVTYIGLRQERRTALPEPYQPSCRDTWPRKLKHYLQNSTRYTREDCLKICHQEIIRYMCKCESQSLPFSSSVDRKMPLCGEQSWECVRNVRAIMDLKTVERFCRCYRSCVDIDYQKEVSFSALPENIHNNDTGPQRRLLAQVVVYFKTLTFESVASVPKYDLDRVHSSFCGINGMSLGVSFLMLFSMLDACARALWSYCRERRQRRHHQLSSATSSYAFYWK